MKNALTKHRKLLILSIILIALILGIVISFTVSVRPSSFLLRKVFENNMKKTNNILKRHLSNQDIIAAKDINYNPADKDAFLDIYYPPNENSSEVGTIFWVHGGGWLSGSKNDFEYWARILAAEGFSVVTIDYSLAPKNHYPIPVDQTNHALGYLDRNQDNLNINMNKLILAGDSAGAQIVAQIALLTTNLEYARKMAIYPMLHNNQIKGLLLNCGPYDLKLAASTENLALKKLVETMMWSYTGEKNFLDAPLVQYMSIPEYVDGNFPPSFITTGNADPLLSHSKSLSAALKSKGVLVDELFYSKDHTPALGHEYQFNLDLEEGREALARMIKFSRRALQ